MVRVFDAWSQIFNVFSIIFVRIIQLFNAFFLLLLLVSSLWLASIISHRRIHILINYIIHASSITDQLSLLSLCILLIKDIIFESRIIDKFFLIHKRSIRVLSSFSNWIIFILICFMDSIKHLLNILLRFVLRSPCLSVSTTRLGRCFTHTIHRILLFDKYLLTFNFTLISIFFHNWHHRF